MPSNIQPPSPSAWSMSTPAWQAVASSAVDSVSAYCSVKVSGRGSSTSTSPRNSSSPGIARPWTSS
ncbi:hypothetical protein [Saccharopolyspora hordei]|uniref:Uncharacterized protein n=1 Tax=Saccharopolyspora hordei TaxID=1838 RepID=A0A853AMH5_9PSEU|nr:hypothetical protein [Saccharopolyspora hordei]NYI84279.1 hypothetical protein [Saccharopolyspora hordei]